MTNRKHSPAHDIWHRRVEGQIQHTIGQHPKWFNLKNDSEKRTMINSLAKRIVGEIMADITLARIPGVDGGPCPRSVESERCFTDVAARPEYDWCCAPGVNSDLGRTK